MKPKAKHPFKVNVRMGQHLEERCDAHINFYGHHTERILRRADFKERSSALLSASLGATNFTKDFTSLPVC